LHHQRGRLGGGAGVGPEGRGCHQPSDRGLPVPSDRASPRVTAPVAATGDAMGVVRVFREAYGQAVATLIRIFGDITLAEDAVQDAFVVASDRWPRSGIPPNPAGWIVTTARNRAIDDLRRSARGRQLHEELGAVVDSSREAGIERREVEGPERASLRTEAIRLARALVELMPDEPEAAGLLALMLLSESRAPARTNDGSLVLLRDQDRTRWDRALIEEGHAIVRACIRRG